MSTLIQRTPGVCGGEACIGMTRIAVWMLEEARRAGVGDLDLLKDYPGLSVFDLEAAWQYVDSHHEEIDEAVRRNQVLSPSKFDVGRSMSDVPGFARRAARGNTADLAEILARVPDAPPATGDERE